MNLQCAVERNDDDQGITQERLTSARREIPSLLQGIHFCLVGGQKNIGGRAFLNLPGENVGGIKIEPHLVSLCFSYAGLISFIASVRLEAAWTVSCAA